MAHITFNFHSQVLDFHQTVHLLVPDANIYGALAGRGGYRRNSRFVPIARPKGRGAYLDQLYQH